MFEGGCQRDESMDYKNDVRDSAIERSDCFFLAVRRENDRAGLSLGDVLLHSLGECREMLSCRSSVTGIQVP